jgi:phosphoglycerol transferase
MPPAGTGALSRLRSPLPVLAMALAWIAIGAWLYARSAGLNPAIFADEWYYSKMARLQPLAEAIVPSYLYLWIFKASNACGDGFLDCVRFGNIVFFAGAAPFIYLSARQVAGRGMAFAVTVLALLAPVNLYTALFMPEACYYFGFAVLAWVALTRTAWGWAGQGAAAGLVLGLMSLIKVHAVFLLPGVCLFLACAGQLRGEAAWLRRGMQSAVLAALLALAVKFGLGWVLAGETGLSLFGSFYSNTATTTARTSKLALLAPAFINGRGHLMALAVLLPLPLAMILHALVSRAARARLDPPMKSLLLFSFLMLGSAAGLTVVYTASIRDQGLDEILRLHLRYYSFVFPLLLMVAAAAVGRPLPGPRSRSAWLAAALVAAAILVAQVKLPLYRLSTIDGPELASAVGGTGQALAALDLLVLLLWACGSRLAAPLFLFAAVPLAAGNGMNDNAFYLAQLKTSWAPEKAGRFAHAYVPVAEHNRIAVVGETTQEVMRTQFQIDAPDVAPIELPKGAPIERYHIPARINWLLVVGKNPLPEGMTPVAATEDYTLVKLNANFRLAGSARLPEPYGKGIVSGAEGLSFAEPWGRWSNAKHVVLHFSQPLPKHVRIGFKARAFNVNSTLPFTMRVGDQEKSFRVSEYEQELSLEFTTDGGQRSLDIEVPRPVSPQELGLSVDVRKLGIGLGAVDVYDTGPRAD